MEPNYKPYAARTPDYQYRNLLKSSLPRRLGGSGIYIRNQFQENGRFSNLAAPPMDIWFENGFPLITERKIPFWRKFINEMWAFMNGARTLEEMRQYGDEKTWPHFWQDWLSPEKCNEFGLKAGDMGEGSYAVLGNYPSPGGVHFNQFLAMIEQARDFPTLTTHMVTSWMPFYALGNSKKKRRVVVAPCHGTVVRVIIIDGKLTLQHVQRSADMPVGAVGNIVGYSAIALALARALNVVPERYVHIFMDAHTYEDQIPWVETMIEREPYPFPTMRIAENAPTDFLSLRANHFILTDYESHPAINDIPVTN